MPSLAGLLLCLFRSTPLSGVVLAGRFLVFSRFIMLMSSSSITTSGCHPGVLDPAVCWEISFLAFCAASLPVPGFLFWPTTCFGIMREYADSGSFLLCLAGFLLGFLLAPATFCAGRHHSSMPASGWLCTLLLSQAGHPSRLRAWPTLRVPPVLGVLCSLLPSSAGLVLIPLAVSRPSCPLLLGDAAGEGSSCIGHTGILGPWASPV